MNATRQVGNHLKLFKTGLTCTGLIFTGLIHATKIHK